MNYVQGLQPYQCRELGFALGLNAKQVNQLTKIMLGLYKLFNEKDLALVELNPLAIMTNGDLAVLDGKINSDDNATVPPPGPGRDARHPPGRRDRGARPASTTSTTSPWTATSAAWSTAPAWRWRRWT